MGKISNQKNIDVNAKNPHKLGIQLYLIVCLRLLNFRLLT